MKNVSRIDKRSNKKNSIISKESLTQENITRQKRGYLNKDYICFHLTDHAGTEYEYHYHDFDKIYILIKGDVTYRIEGRAYHLQPNDIVLVKSGLMHRPEVNGTDIYERIIVYIDPLFLSSFCGSGCDLGTCFDNAASKSEYVFRMPAVIKSRLWQSVRSFESAELDSSSGRFAASLYDRTRFIEMMIELNRAAMDEDTEYVSREYGGRALEIIDYINAHLTEDLSIEKLSSHFYINRYYLMHIFRDETGGTVGNYISSKRLLMARNMIRSGTAATQACFGCGFGNYSAFYRAYKKEYGISPGTSVICKDDMLQE
ncbi:MAG: helix-turn-helix domain-containing protein [Lachnospiraceae bacterium]|nr:helix-turn-helix domain-containing protein [Lachnospiraceae bacterium]